MTNSVRTQKFLRLVARRLSGRDDCKHVEFQIGIGSPLKRDHTGWIWIPDSAAVNYIFFDPDILVYKDTHHRGETDKFRIVDLILNKHFPELIIGRDEIGNLKVDTSQFVTGVYKYQKSYDEKRRRWVRMLRNRYC